MPLSPSYLTRSAQLIQLGFICISLPICFYFSVLAWFIRSLCLALKVNNIHGHKVCIFAGRQAVSGAVGFVCSGSVTCTGLIFRADFIFMHDISRLSLGYPKNLAALTDTWLQINIT